MTEIIAPGTIVNFNPTGTSVVVARIVSVKLFPTQAPDYEICYWNEGSLEFKNVDEMLLEQNQISKTTIGFKRIDAK